MFVVCPLRIEFSPTFIPIRWLPQLVHVPQLSHKDTSPTSRESMHVKRVKALKTHVRLKTSSIFFLKKLLFPYIEQEEKNYGSA